MPNIPVSEQEEVKKNPATIISYGQLNYFITLTMIEAFKHVPRYDTIHEIYRDFVQEPKKNGFLQRMETEFADRFTIGDIRTAAAEAYLEFHRRIVSRYEDIKVKLNGELPEYLSLFKQLDELEIGHIKAAMEEAELDKAIEPTE